MTWLGDAWRFRHVHRTARKMYDNEIEYACVHYFRAVSANLDAIKYLPEEEEHLWRLAMKTLASAMIRIPDDKFVIYCDKFEELVSEDDDD